MDNNSHSNFKRIVEYHKEKIGQGYHKALQKLNAYPPELRAEWTPLAIAVLMHVHTCHSMRTVFAGVPGATPKKKRGGAFILELDGAPIGIPDIAELKCKKVDEKLLTSNIPTEAVKDFHNQRPEQKRPIQGALADWVAPKTVGSQEPGHGNAGYMLNALKTGFEKLCVTYLTGLKSADLILELPVDDTQSTVINLNVGEITEIAPRKRVKARGKKTDAAKSDEKPKKRLKLVSTNDESTEEYTKKRARKNGAGS